MRAAVLSKGLGGLATTALVVTAICVYLANRSAFAPATVIGSRMVLLVSLGAVATLLLILPLLRLRHGQPALQAADEAERRSPAFAGRLRTWADESDRTASGERRPSPLLSLLARETEQAVAAVPLDTVVSRPMTLAFAGIAITMAATLIWMGSAGPGYWQYGTARLWTGWFLPATEPLYELLVEPGDTTIRQGGRLDVTATPVGFDPGSMQIFAKFESSVDWERAPMAPEMEGSGFRFGFSMVREPLRYYIEAGRMRSREFEVGVVVMPSVESLRLDYEYPEWSGLEPNTEDPGGDILAVHGTRVTVTVRTDKPLEDGLLVVNDEAHRLRGGKAVIEIAEDSTYHLAATYRGERVRLTEDYFITALPDEKPEVKIKKPGRDWRASGIEEVAVQIEATDDFGLRRLELHYSVNGAEQDPVRLSVRRGSRHASGTHLFRLEDMGEPLGDSGMEATQGLPPPLAEAGLLPGSLVSYYVLAADAQRETRSDMYFVNVQPFERRFSQSQQGGGQGGQGQQQEDEISRRQREIVIATWNLIKERDEGDGRDEEKLRQSATMLSQLQATLMQQAQTLAQRTRARQITNADPKFAQFTEFLEQAASYMEPAAEELNGFRLDEAVEPEQKALQYLLRAENLFTDIQVSMGRGGGAGGGASRDLAEMFELEMDLEKNQYETGGGATGQQIEQEVDEAMRKLEELARRQEQLAERAQNQARASFEQRWQQEMLRREAEDLRRQLQQLQRRNQQQQGAQQGGQQAQGGQGGGRSGQRGNRQELEQAIQQLERAAQQMQQGANANDLRASSEGARRELQEAVEGMRQRRRAQSQAALSEMTREASELAREQEETAKTVEESLRHALKKIEEQGGRSTGQVESGLDRETEIELADRKQDIGDRLAEIEKGMQEQARSLKERSPQASRALLNALVELRESQAAAGLQYASEMIRRGMAPYVARNEEGISRGLRGLRRNLEQASELAEHGGQGEVRESENLLSDVERLRRSMESAIREGNQGARTGSQDPGQGQEQASGQRQNGGQPSGSQASQSQNGGSQQARGGSLQRGDRGGRLGGWGGPRGPFDRHWRGDLRSVPRPPEMRRRMEEALESSASSVPELAEGVRRTGELDPQDILALRNLAREVSQGDYRNNPELLEREYRNMLALLEQLEVALRRQVELGGNEEVRSMVAEPIPEQYREAVAEYYRRLGGSQ